MGWTVRNEFGALEFETLEELELSRQLGLVSSADEIRGPGAKQWHKVGSPPGKRKRTRVRSLAALAKASPVPVGYLLAVLLVAAGSLYVLARGAWVLSLLLCLILAGMLTAVTHHAFRTRGRPGAAQ